jgi:hypothetical protein
VLAFLDDEHPAVRCWAAVDALDLSPDDGLRVLKELAEGPKSEVRFNARMILKMWDAGEWPPDSR